MQNKHYLIVYDIKDVKRLQKVSKCMESYAVRVQKSVFETYAPPSTIEDLKKRLNWIIEQETDFVLIFEICERDFQKRESFGKFAENNFDDSYKIL